MLDCWVSFLNPTYDTPRHIKKMKISRITSTIANYKNKIWALIWILVSITVLTSATLNKVDDENRAVFSDQSAHLMASMSIWHDLDLRYSLRDLERFNSLLPEAHGPRGMFLKRNEDGELFYAKPFLYAALAAPFYGIFGTSGFIILNFMAIIIIATLTFNATKKIYGPGNSHILAMAFIFLSPFIAWVPIMHPDIIIALLLFTGGYLLLAGNKTNTVILGGFVLGLAVYEKPTFAVIVPFLLLAASQLNWKARLSLLASMLIGWSLPTLVNVMQDGNILAYQGLRFYVENAPFPLEDGWIESTKGSTNHVFNLPQLITALLGNLMLLPQKIFDSLIGRQTGILLYFPIAAFFLMTSMFIRTKATIFVLSGLFAYLVLNWLSFPTNGFGGAGSYGPRYLMQALPLTALALITCVKNPLSPRIPKSNIISAIAILFIIVSVIFQNKVLPPSEELVRDPAIYLRSNPAKIFPLEQSLLPSIPMYVSWFSEKSADSKTRLYRTKNFNNGIIHIKDKPTTSEVVLYQLSEDSPVPDLAITASSTVHAALRTNGRIIWQGDIKPNKTAIVSLSQDIFKTKYFDMLSFNFVRWAAINLEIIPLSSDSNLELADVSFLKNDRKNLVEYSKVISVNDFSESGITKLFGWSKNEPWGVWSDGQYADIFFRLPGIPVGGIDVNVGVQPYIPSDHPTQTAEVYVNDKLIDKWIFDHASDSKRVIHIDSKYLPDPDVVLAFRMLNPASPSILGHSSDNRLLGIGLRDIEITPNDFDN